MAAWPPVLVESVQVTLPIKASASSSIKWVPGPLTSLPPRVVGGAKTVIDGKRHWKGPETEDRRLAALGNAGEWEAWHTAPPPRGQLDNGSK